ncbi:hypothetical protein L210DRAFT_858041 [Boletus edulis BED1]|uniref:Uncharacterized protein n=1 Tax=Boletus edulis BED1 TaxID=1328754 RepID=A0AAD4GEL5_BOLED|nr:hypothetical protein L210DRAFT_858041 [Boletus edulis BED1]
MDRTKKKIKNGVIKVTAQKNPVFLYDGDIFGENFNPNNVADGFLCGFLVEHIMKHIFTSPLSALSSSKSQSICANNTKIHKITQVDGYYIAYAAVHRIFISTILKAWFNICSQDKFIDADSHFRFPDFYYRIVDFITNSTDADWVKELLGRYNKWVAIIMMILYY